MRPHDLLRFFLLNGLAVGLGAVVATSCVDVNYPTVAFRCNPRQSDNCPDTHYCCSDDPAAEGGRLPAYRDDIPNSGAPLFSANNNGFSTSGMCVDLDDVPCGSGLAQTDPTTGGCGFPNCPIPCNPTWDSGDIERVCGPMRQCCQTVQLEPEDCISDGEGGFRPVTGADIPNNTQWRAADHQTHQDPNGRSCTAITGSMDVRDPGFRACLDQLTVANQRGFCMPTCPATLPPGPDACELRSQGTPGV
jgi:hypothetical protein